MSSKNDMQPRWRPDFKTQSTLPDIKVVRTDFIINAIVVALVLIAVFTLLHREYRVRSLNGSIASMEQRIRSSEVADDLNLKESERFRKSAQSVEELERFFRAPLIPHELLASLALLKPEDLIFSRVILTESIMKEKKNGKAQVTYQIKITGDARGLMVLTEFKEALQASASINPAGFVLKVNESMQRRDAKTGITPFQISISLTPGVSAAPSKGGNK